MGKLFDSAGKAVTILAGNAIAFSPRQHCVAIWEKVVDGRPVRLKKWLGGGYNKAASFLRNEDDFREFAAILAETHGLKIKNGHTSGLVYIFVP